MQHDNSIRETLADLARDTRWAAYEREERERQTERRREVSEDRLVNIDSLMCALWEHHGELARHVRAHGDVVRIVLSDPTAPIEVVDAVRDLCHLETVDIGNERRGSIEAFAWFGNIVYEDDVQTALMMINDYCRELDRRKSRAVRTVAVQVQRRTRVSTALRHRCQRSRSSRRARVVARVAAKTTATGDPDGPAPRQRTSSSGGAL